MDGTVDGAQPTSGIANAKRLTACMCVSHPQNHDRFFSTILIAYARLPPRLLVPQIPSSDAPVQQTVIRVDRLSAQLI